MNQQENTTIDMQRLPVLPLRGISVFPGMTLNFDVERKLSVAALNAAMLENQTLLLVAQKELSKDMPTADDLYQVGTICKIRQLLRLSGSTGVRVIVEGVQRAYMRKLTEENACYFGEVEAILDAEEEVSARDEAMVRHCYSLFDEYAQLSGTVPPELFLNLLTRQEPGYVSDYVAQNIYLSPAQKQTLLEEARPSKRLTLLNTMLSREIRVLRLEQELQEKTQEQVGQSQKEYYLREQMKVIQSELGEGEDQTDEIEVYRKKIGELKFAKEIEEKLLREVTRLSRQHFGSADANVIRTYLDTCLDIPWHVRTKEMLDLQKAEKVLDTDHFGLHKVKERILEFLAVRQLAPDVKGGILCLVGPPGVGKTSIASSIAKATGRKFARLSLGGVHDEAEIRGHRKTYVGAMPGRIMQAMIQAKSANPVLLLDEIDKLGSDYRGDPSAALLEALDAEQNNTFRDHYLEIPFDLSEVFFITTANSLDTIPRPLLDRMEIIELGSYTDEEKLQIAKKHLLPKQRKKHGITGMQLKLTDDAIREVIALYTRESGVRVLERHFATICRKTAKEIAAQATKSIRIKSGQLEKFLGAPRYRDSRGNTSDEIGLCHGLAWTQVGGELLDVEVSILEGTGKLVLTGNLGDVMKESAQAAISYIRSRHKTLHLPSDFHVKSDIHIHFPESAVPKDGPSAGITMCVAVISALTETPVRHTVAMTGEISLRGRILPIGGLKEKTMAALRAGIETVIIPAENEKDLEEIDPMVRAALNFVSADHIDHILDIALVKTPTQKNTAGQLLWDPESIQRQDISSVPPDSVGAGEKQRRTEIPQ